MSAKNSNFRMLLAVSYLLTIVASAPFHTHSLGGDPPSRVAVTASHCDEDHDCPVCQFLAQKPAPAATVASVGPGIFVQEVVAVASACADRGAFSAWHSRAPPMA